MTARLLTFARVRATPAPIAAEPPSVAEPSALEAASAFAAEASSTVRPAVSWVTSAVTPASTVMSEMTTPTAAATATEPPSPSSPEVSAFGDCLVPEFLVPFLAAAVSA